MKPWGKGKVGKVTKIRRVLKTKPGLRTSTVAKKVLKNMGNKLYVPKSKLKPHQMTPRTFKKYKKKIAKKN